MDAACKVQGNIHLFRLTNNMCPGFWVHITRRRCMIICSNSIPSFLLLNCSQVTYSYYEMGLQNGTKSETSGSLQFPLLTHFERGLISLAYSVCVLLPVSQNISVVDFFIHPSLKLIFFINKFLFSLNIFGIFICHDNKIMYFVQI